MIATVLWNEAPWRAVPLANTSAKDNKINEKTAEEHARTIEQFLTTAEIERYGEIVHPPESVAYRLDKFVRSYIEGEIYPLERLEECTLRLADVRLQTQYITTILGFLNTAYYTPVNIRPEAANSPRVKIARLALNQALIGGVRITWEKLFRLLYYLETGKSDVSGSSVKRSFFKWVKSEAKWRFLEPYEREIEHFDSTYRTAEFHKGSKLRGEILHGRAVEVNEILQPHNHALNTIWPNLIEILHGRPASHFTTLHMLEGFKIDPRYTQNG